MNEFKGDFMRKIRIGFVFATFLFSSLGFSFGAKDDVQRDILTLYAVMDVMQYAAELGSVWSREDRKEGDKNDDFDNKASLAAELISGKKATNEAQKKAANLASHELIWLSFTYRGIDKAHTIAYQYDSDKLSDSVIAAARSARKSGADAEQVALAASREALKFMSQNKDKIREDIQENITGFLLARDSDFEKILKILKSPLGTDAFSKYTLPEIQAYYKNEVSNIEKSIIDLDLID